MMMHCKAPVMPNFLRAYTDTVLTDSIRVITPCVIEQRRESVVILPPLDGAWLQELQDMPRKKQGMQHEVSFVSSFSSRTAAIPPSIREDEAKCCGCCSWG